MRNLPSLQEPRWKIIYSDTRSENGTFKNLKQSDTDNVEITSEDLQTAKYESSLVEKFVMMNARRDAIKQIDVSLSIIGNRDSKEYRDLVDFKNVLEYLTDHEFIKYVYKQSDPDKVKTYVHMISNELTTKMPARQYMIMYLAAMSKLLGGADQARIDRLDRLIEILNSISDRAYIDMVMDVMYVSGTMTDTLSTVLRKYGVGIINELKER